MVIVVDGHVNFAFVVATTLVVVVAVFVLYNNILLILVHVLSLDLVVGIELVGTVGPVIGTDFVDFFC